MHLAAVGDLAGQPVGQGAPPTGRPPCSSPVVGVEAVGGTDTRRF
jgi:hypothetical protein